MRGMTLSAKVDGFGSIIPYLYLIVAGSLAGLQLHSLNVAMENYDQIEIVPIYQTSLILLNIICGAIILDERDMYRWFELIFLVFCSTLCIAGVFIMVRKPKMGSGVGDEIDPLLTENLCSKNQNNCPCQPPPLSEKFTSLEKDE
jgi:hypothetical protein